MSVQLRDVDVGANELDVLSSPASIVEGGCLGFRGNQTIGRKEDLSMPKMTTPSEPSSGAVSGLGWESPFAPQHSLEECTGARPIGRMAYPYRVKRLTAEELQAARRAASDRYMQIGLAMLREAQVEAYTFHEKGLHGQGSRKHVTCPKPTTRRRLYVLAHECGHAAHGHLGGGKGRSPHREEYEAECYAHEAMRRHGVAVPRKETKFAREYVARRIDMAVRRGATKLDREAVGWTRGFHYPATQKALAAKRVALVDMSQRARVQAVSPMRSPVEAPTRKRVTLAETLRTAARESGLSVKEIARRAKLDQSALNRFLNRTRANIRLDVLESLMVLLNLEVRRSDVGDPKLGR